MKFIKNLQMLNLISSLLNLFLITGLYLDGWAHEHIKGIDSFFTPWHGVYYTGFFAVASFIVIPQLFYFLKHRKKVFIYPSAYKITFLGVLLFAAGGVGDIIWHTNYGFEKNIEALLSPTHLSLYLGMFLIYAGTLNASLEFSSKKNSPANTFSIILSTAIIFSYFTFFTQYASPLISPFAFETHRTSNHYYGETIGLVSLFIHNLFLVGCIIYTLLRSKIQTGSLTLILTLNGIGMATIHDHYDFIISGFLAGILLDLIVYFLKPSVNQNGKLYFLGFIIPAVFTALYFLVGSLTRGIWWTPHLWLGSILLCGFFSTLLTSLVVQKKVNPENQYEIKNK